MRMNLPYAEDPKNASIIDVDHLAIVPDGAIQKAKINRNLEERSVCFSGCPITFADAQVNPNLGVRNETRTALQ